MSRPDHVRLTLDGARPFRADPILFRPVPLPRPCPDGLVAVHVVTGDGTLAAGFVAPTEAARLEAAAQARRERIRYAALVTDRRADPFERQALAHRLAERRAARAWYRPTDSTPSPASSLN